MSYELTASMMHAKYGNPRNIGQVHFLYVGKKIIKLLALKDKMDI